MTFKDVIIRNFTKSIRKYMSYFLSGVFCVAMFFVYSTMILMEDVIHSVDEYPMFFLFVVTCVIVSLFSVFFIHYSHQSFMKNKKKELAVYMTVGMDDSATRRMLGTETAIIALSSIVVGILTGILFARIFQLIVLRLVDVDDMTFCIKPINFLITFIVFAVIYLFCFLLSDRQLSREDISTIMKEKRKSEFKAYRPLDTILAVLGLTGIIFAAVFILNIAKDNSINSKWWVLVSFLGSGYIGLFLLIGFGGKTVLHLLKGRKNYYRHMMTVSEIEHKYGQNLRIILILSMMASMIVLLVGSPIALLNITSDIAEDGNPDLAYAVENTDDDSVIKKQIEEYGVESWNTVLVSCVQNDDGVMKPILSVTEYNTQMNTELTMESGTIYHMITNWVPGTHGVEIGDDYTIHTLSQDRTYRVSDSIKGDWTANSLFATDSLLILADEDYEMIRDELTYYNMNTIMFSENWKKSGALVENLHTQLTLMSSRYDIYQQLKHGYSVFLFVMCSMCVMFFVSTGGVLYFKQYNEIDDERKQWKKLNNLGISDRAVKRSISAKLAVVYFVPLLGSVMGILVMYYLASLFGGQTITGMFMKKGLIGFGCYAASQMIFYLFLRTRYLHDVFLLKE